MTTSNIIYTPNREEERRERPAALPLLADPQAPQDVEAQRTEAQRGAFAAAFKRLSPFISLRRLQSAIYYSVLVVCCLLTVSVMTNNTHNTQTLDRLLNTLNTVARIMPQHQVQMDELVLITQRMNDTLSVCISNSDDFFDESSDAKQLFGADFAACPIRYTQLLRESFIVECAAASEFKTPKSCADLQEIGGYFVVAAADVPDLTRFYINSWGLVAQLAAYNKPLLAQCGLVEVNHARNANKTILFFGK